MFRFKLTECFSIFKFIKQQKKLWYLDPWSLLQCKSSISHHGSQIIATHYLLCYYHLLLLLFSITTMTTLTVYGGGGGVRGQTQLGRGRGRGRIRRQQ